MGKIRERERKIERERAVKVAVILQRGKGRIKSKETKGKEGNGKENVKETKGRLFLTYTIC